MNIPDSFRKSGFFFREDNTRERIAGWDSWISHPRLLFTNQKAKSRIERREAMLIPCRKCSLEFFVLVWFLGFGFYFYLSQETFKQDIGSFSSKPSSKFLPELLFP